MLFLQINSGLGSSRSAAAGLRQGSKQSVHIATRHQTHFITTRKCRGPLRKCGVATNEVFQLASLDVSAIAITSALAAAAGVGGWRFYLYSQLEYITASMLGRNVPVVAGDGARVIQLGAGTKELYYYPKGTGLVTVVAEDVNPGLYEQASIQAQVGVVGRKQDPSNLLFAEEASADAVVALRTLGRLPPNKVLPALSEIHRVLKPGAPLIFVERVEDSAPLRGLLGSSDGILGSEFFQELKESPRFDVVSWDVAFQGQDPHAVGLAFKAAKQAQKETPSTGKGQRKRASGKGSDTAGFGR